MKKITEEYNNGLLKIEINFNLENVNFYEKFNDGTCNLIDLSFEDLLFLVKVINKEKGE